MSFNDYLKEKLDKQNDLINEAKTELKQISNFDDYKEEFIKDYSNALNQALIDVVIKHIKPESRSTVNNRLKRGNIWKLERDFANKVAGILAKK